MSFETIVGVAASIATAISLVPQLVKVFKEKKAENVSIGMLVILFCGLVLWIVYGCLKEDYIIIVSNSFSLLMNLLLSGLAIKYKKENA